MEPRWPEGFDRVPDQEWIRDPPDPLATSYDEVKRHGWYRNLDRTLEQVQRLVTPGGTLVDYSGGTGIFTGRLLETALGATLRVVIADSSPKFLRLALERFRECEPVAFRLLRYRPAERRLETLGEVLPDLSADAIVSTNAIHLYDDLDGAFDSWARALRPGGRLFVQSGNIRNPDKPAGAWIIDETILEIRRLAADAVGRDPLLSAHRGALADPARRAAYDGLFRKYFPEVRPLETYLRAAERSGLRVETVLGEEIPAKIDDWFRFLSVYHEGILPWVGGASKVDGTPPSEAAVADRLRLIRDGLTRLFPDTDEFRGYWTYLVARKP